MPRTADLYYKVQRPPVQAVRICETFGLCLRAKAEGDVAHDSASGHDGTLISVAAWQPAGGVLGGALVAPRRASVREVASL